MSILTRLVGGLLRGKAATDSADSLAKAGIERLGQGDLAAAERDFSAAIGVDPACAAAHCGLGVLRQKQGEDEAALHHLRLAAQLAPWDRVIVLRSAQGLDELGAAADAIEVLEPVAAEHPGEWKASFRLARLLGAKGDFGGAAAAIERTVAANPAAGGALEELAILYRDSGRIDEALELYERIAALNPGSPTAHSVILFHELYREHDRAELAQRHRVWGRRFARPVAMPRFANPPLAERKLRVGYLSADFRRSSAAPFIEPLLSARDRERFEVVCYSASRTRDGVSERLASLADGWRGIAELDDDALEVRVREDAIDILVDLNGHTTGNRLTAFGRRLAPVQATYLGYGATTGVTAIDFRITDRVIDPPGQTERYYSERLAVLPDAMWCFVPPREAPAASAGRPGGGAASFAALNNVAKVSQAALEAWAEILARAPNARLVFAGVPPGKTRARALEPFTRRGVGADRLTFHDRMSYADYLALHQHVDIALDSFPYSGGATTCDALWMGVPVLTLAGDAVPARSGASMLTALGLQDWIANSPEEYVAKGVRYAGERAALDALHRSLRERMTASPLCDAPRFMRGFEAQLRMMWRNWCAAEPV